MSVGCPAGSPTGTGLVGVHVTLRVTPAPLPPFSRQCPAPPGRSPAAARRLRPPQLQPRRHLPPAPAALRPPLPCAAGQHRRLHHPPALQGAQEDPHGMGEVAGGKESPASLVPCPDGLVPCRSGLTLCPLGSHALSQGLVMCPGSSHRVPGVSHHVPGVSRLVPGVSRHVLGAHGCPWRISHHLPGVSRCIPGVSCCVQGAHAVC